MVLKALLVGLALVAAPTTAATPTVTPLLTATAVVSCGEPRGMLVTYPNGDQELWDPPPYTAEQEAQLFTVPKNRRNILDIEPAGGCPLKT